MVFESGSVQPGKHRPGYFRLPGRQGGLQNQTRVRRLALSLPIFESQRERPRRPVAQREFKSGLLTEMQRLAADPGHVDAVLADGAERAAAIAGKVLAEVQKIVGFLRP